MFKLRTPTIMLLVLLLPWSVPRVFAANIFGVRDLGNDDTRDGSLMVKPGEELRLRYRVVIHPADASSAGLANLYADYAR